MLSMSESDAKRLAAATKYIDSWLEFNFDDYRLPGMSVAIQHGDKLVYSRAFGYANVTKKEKLTTKHAFRIASHSKTFTATAILQLKEAGKLDLDAEINKYLAWFISSKDERVAHVTIRQLLNHTAGVIRDGEDSDYWQLMRPFPEEAELQDYIKTSSLIIDSDEKFKYSNFAYAYLGSVIAAVSGVSFNEYVTKNIVDKLNLKDTGPELDDHARKILATGYGMMLFKKDRKTFEHIDTRALSPATGFYTTPEELCKYFAAHFFGNNTLINDQSKRLMQHGYWVADEYQQKYGLGMANYLKKGWHLYGHSGGCPGFITNTQFDAKKRLVSTVHTNAYDGFSKAINNSIINIIEKFQNQAGKDTKNLKKFTGRYYCSWGVLDITLIGDTLFVLHPMNWADVDDIEELSFVDANTLKIEKTDSFSSEGELIHFEFGADGKPTHIRYAGRTLLSYEGGVKQGWF